MIVLLLLTRNEGDLLRHNLLHHLDWGVDHVAVADNGSTDHTQEVLRSFGDSVTTMVFADLSRRLPVLSELLERAERRHGRFEWAGVSDTDELWWSPSVDLRTALADVPAGVMAANCDQKQFLPTELDPDEGPVFCRRSYHAAGKNSPLFTGYRTGKSFYRTSWLRGRVLTSPHFCRALPRPPWQPPEQLLHHYYVQSEDNFVEKVARLGAWRSPRRRRYEAFLDLARRAARRPTVSPRQEKDKRAWWAIYATGGEAGLREYYRHSYVLQSGDVPGYLERGELVEDPGLADHSRRRLLDSGGPA